LLTPNEQFSVISYGEHIDELAIISILYSTKMLLHLQSAS